jgi:hypothetical protein
VDISQYILKSEIPACPTCPICPECPICPVCPPIPPQKQCKKIYEYNITQHPDIDSYISKKDLAKNYIKKSDVLNSDIVKKLKELAELKEMGVINEDEFSQMKARLIENFEK